MCLRMLARFIYIAIYRDIYIIIYIYYSKRCSKNFEIVQNSRYRRLGDIIISTSHVESRDSRYVLQKLRADVVYDNGVVEISLLHVCTGETSI